MRYEILFDQLGFLYQLNSWIGRYFLNSSASRSVLEIEAHLSMPYLETVVGAFERGFCLSQERTDRNVCVPSGQVQPSKIASNLCQGSWIGGMRPLNLSQLLIFAVKIRIKTSYVCKHASQGITRLHSLHSSYCPTVHLISVDGIYPVLPP